MLSTTKSTIAIGRGDDATKTISYSAAPNSTNRRALLNRVNVAVVFGLGVMAYILQLNYASTSSPEGLLQQIEKPTHGLDTYDKLKQHFIQDEMEITKDKILITELEERKTKMVSGLENVARTLYAVESKTKKSGKRISEAMEAMEQSNDKIRRDDIRLLNKLMGEDALAHEKLYEERQENLALKDLLGEMKLLTEKQKKTEGLRGSQSKYQ
jgi:hypothetical protein